MKKKSQAVFFLVELLILATVVIILMVAAAKFVSMDSKYLEFDSYNLALFLERIPSIEGNFRYEIDFNGSIDIDIKSDRVVLDRPKTKTKRFVEEYNNPVKYQLEESFTNVESLYFYKIGDKIYVREEIDSDLNNMLQMKLIPELRKHNVVSLSGSRGVSAFDLTIPNSAYSYFLEDVSKDVSILYNSKGKYSAYTFYNEIIQNNYNSELEGISLRPLQDYSLLEIDIPEDELELVPFFMVVTSRKDVEVLLS